MDEQAAKIVIGAGAAIGVLVWLVALQLYRKMADAPTTVVVESAVRGASPCDAIARLLANVGNMAQQAKLSRPTDNVVELTQFRCHLRVEAQRTGSQTMLTAELDDAPLRRMMQRVLALFVVLLMPLAIVGISTAL